MAKAKTEGAEMLRVRFAARPPARLVAGEVVIEAGDEGELPAAQARELARNPHVEVELLDEQLPAEDEPSGDLPGVDAHVNPADEPEEEKE